MAKQFSKSLLKQALKSKIFMGEFFIGILTVLLVGGGLVFIENSLMIKMIMVAGLVIVIVCISLRFREEVKKAQDRVSNRAAKLEVDEIAKNAAKGA